MEYYQPHEIFSPGAGFSVNPVWPMLAGLAATGGAGFMDWINPRPWKKQRKNAVN